MTVLWQIILWALFYTCVFVCTRTVLNLAGALSTDDDDFDCWLATALLAGFGAAFAAVAAFSWAMHAAWGWLI